MTDFATLELWIAAGHVLRLAMESIGHDVAANQRHARQAQKVDNFMRMYGGRHGMGAAGFRRRTRVESGLVFDLDDPVEAAAVAELDS